MKSRILLSAGLALVLSTSGCGDDPFRITWEGNPGEALVYSLDREELNRPSGFNMMERRTVLVEAPTADGRWDFVLDRQDGGLVFLPPRALGVESRAAISPIPGATWEDVREAPRDSLAFVTDAPVPVVSGTIYVVRTHQQFDFFGRQCVFYGKVEAVDFDLEQGTLRFSHDTNPECNDRRLVPRGS